MQLKHRKLEKEAADNQQKFHHATEKLLAERSLLTETTVELQSSKAECIAKAAALQEVSNSLGNLKASFEIEMTRSSKENEDLNNERNRLVKSFEDQLAKNTACVEQLKRDISEKEAAIGKLTTQHSSSVSFIQQKDEFIKKLSQNVKEMSQSHKKELSSLSIKLSQQRDGREGELLTSLSTKEQCITDLKLQLSTLQLKLADSKQQLDEREKTAKDLRDQRENLNSVIAAKEKEKTPLLNKLATLTDQLTQERNAAAKHINEINILHQQTESVNKEINQQNVNDMETRLSEYTKLRNEMASTIQSQTEELSEMKQKEIDNRSKIQVKEDLIVSLMAKIQSKDAEVENLYTSHDDHRSSWRAEKDGLLSELTDVRENLQQQTKEQQILVDKCNDLEKTVRSLDAESTIRNIEHIKEMNEIKKIVDEFKLKCHHLSESVQRENDEHSLELTARDEQHSTEMNRLISVHRKEIQSALSQKDKIIEEKDVQLTKLKTENAKLFEENQSMEEEHSLQVSQLQNDSDTYKQQLKRDKGEVVKLGKQLNEHANEIKSRHREHLAANDVITALQKETSSLHTQLKESENKVHTLETRLQEIALANEMAKIDLSRCKKERDVQLNVKDQEISSLQSRNLALEQRISEIESALVEERKVLGSIQLECTSLREESSHIHDQMLTATKGLNEITAEVHDVKLKHKRKIDDMEKNHGQDLIDLENKSYEAKTEFTLELEKYKSQHDQQITQCKADSEVISKLKAKIDAVSAEKCEIMNELKKVNTVKDELEKNNSDAIAEMKFLSDKKLAVESELKKLQESSCSSIDGLKVILSGKDSLLDGLRNDLVNSESARSDDVRRLGDEVVCLKKSVQALEADKSNLEAAVTEASGFKSMLSVQVLEMKEQVNFTNTYLNLQYLLIAGPRVSYGT